MNKINETSVTPNSSSLAKLEEAYAYKENYTITLAGYQFIMYPGVFNPDVFPSTRIIVDSWIHLIRTIRPNSLLEIGTGAGYFSVLSALNGAKHVTATDITSPAIANAKANIDKYNMNYWLNSYFFLSSVTYPEICRSLYGDAASPSRDAVSLQEDAASL